MTGYWNDDTDRPSRKGYGAITGIVAIIILLLVAAFSVTWASVPPDKIMLHYTGGPIQGTHFVEVVKPGTGTSIYGLNENIWFLPAAQRNYIVDRDPETGDKGVVDVVTGITTDNVSIDWELAVYFKLNSEPAVLRQFFEQICMHEDLGHCQGKGWDKMLDQYIRPVVQNSVRLETGKYDLAHVYKDPATLTTMQNDIAAILKDAINDKVGGDYFCGPDSSNGDCRDFTVVLKNPTPPQNVVDQYNATAAATQKIVTAQKDADAKVATAQGEKDAQDKRAESKPLTQAQIDFIKAQALLACAQNTNCTLIVSDSSDTGVNVNTGT